MKPFNNPRVASVLETIHFCDSSFGKYPTIFHLNQAIMLSKLSAISKLNRVDNKITLNWYWTQCVVHRYQPKAKTIFIVLVQRSTLQTHTHQYMRMHTHTRTHFPDELIAYRSELLLCLQFERNISLYRTVTCETVPTTAEPHSRTVRIHISNTNRGIEE